MYLLAVKEKVKKKSVIIVPKVKVKERLHHCLLGPYSFRAHISQNQ